MRALIVALACASCAGHRLADEVASGAALQTTLVIVGSDVPMQDDALRAAFVAGLQAEQLASGLRLELAPADGAHAGRAEVHVGPPGVYQAGDTHVLDLPVRLDVRNARGGLEASFDVPCSAAGSFASPRAGSAPPPPKRIASRHGVDRKAEKVAYTPLPPELDAALGGPPPPPVGALWTDDRRVFLTLWSDCGREAARAVASWAR